jgi:flagellin-like hook-associated protein FlgL
MSSSITLSAGVRANLLSLQNTAALMQTTQNRLATGKKVNSALDNPLNFFTSSSLGARASDLSGLLDSMSNGIQTIQTANNGLTAITSLVQQLQATVSQARSDASAGTVAATPGTDTAAANNSTQTNNAMTFDIGGGVNVSISTFTHTNAVVSTLGGSSAVVATTDYSGGGATGQLTINDGTTTADIDMTSIDGTGTQQDVVDAINAGLSAAGSTTQATLDGSGKVQLVNNTGDTITVGGTGASGLGFGAGNTASTDGAVATNVALTNAQLAAAINASTQLAGKVSASEASGVLTLNNLSTTTTLTVTGFDSTNVTGDAADSTVIAKGTGGTISNVRQSLLTQFNSLLTQIDTTAADSGYNGINLLNGDTLKLSFNENGTSSVDIQTKDASGNSFAINATNLSISAGTASQFGDNTQLDTLSGTLTTALTTLRTQASALGSSLSVVQTRQDFTKSMINSLQTGADNLVLADSNQEGANLLALQTRQSLSTTALSLSAQADQAVLSLFQ